MLFVCLFDLCLFGFVGFLFLSADRSKAVVPVLVLLFVALLLILRGDLFYVLPCVSLILCFLVLLALRLPRFGEERAYLSAFRTFVRFVLVWICRFPLPLGVWEGLQFVIVALPGLFSSPPPPPPLFFFYFCMRRKECKDALSGYWSATHSL